VGETRVAKGLEQGIEQYRVKTEPFYAEVNGEIGLFKAAASARIRRRGATSQRAPRGSRLIEEVVGGPPSPIL